ncbi:protein-tyrosine phosphatase [Thermoflavifilum aggregans]|uniref:protein-tyrosine-phosphatase n=1 Tax=Thermoflavifilum aggregans TaxID=454188 RepID=A0A2M9CTB1_9BACT|nr:low molecular weight protein-tyrosine-phosphatase [Thermoflavifilum aggregans]PJJ75162.1 protein-tyrosine phosphatase [Thermoflavifilum aggregans]
MHTLPTRVLIVCLGNICRSPMAEGIFRKLAEDYGLAVEVDSAGTSDWHAGEKPDRRAIATASRHGIDISQHRARPFGRADFDRYDYIFVMDRENLHQVMQQARHEDDRKKVFMLTEALSPQHPVSVPDPWFDDVLFEPVFQQIKAACEAWLKKWIAHPEMKNTNRYQHD